MFPGDPTNPPAPAPVAATGAAPEPTPAPVRKRRSIKGYSFLDAASRAEHPIVSALVANALAGPDAYKLLGALQQREEARQATMAAASEKRFEYGRNLALKMGDVAPLDPSDPLRPQFEKAFGAMNAAPAPEGYQRKPPGNFLKKPTPPPHRPIGAEGGIFDVGQGAGGGLEARPIPILPPLGAPPPPQPQGAPGAITKPIPIPPPTGKERPQPVQPSRGRAPIQPIPIHEPTGASLFLKPKPPAEKAPPKPVLKQNEEGFWEPTDPMTGNSLLTGKPVRGKGPASLAGIHSQIDSARLGLENMQQSIARGRKSNLASRTAGAMGQGLTEKMPSLRGVMQEFVPTGKDATVHEQNRKAVAAMLVKPLFGTARGEYLAKMIESAIPHFTDSPEVSDNFYRQTKAFLASAARMPWDKSPVAAQREYEDAAAEFLAAISTPAGDPVEDALTEYERSRGIAGPR